MQKAKKYYISGPITGTDDYMERFKEAEERLKAEGYEVINPAKVNRMLPESTSYQEYMAMSFTMLPMAARIYMLKGWQQSHGACAERNLAEGLSMEIIEE